MYGNAEHTFKVDDGHLLKGCLSLQNDTDTEQKPVSNKFVDFDAFKLICKTPNP